MNHLAIPVSGLTPSKDNIFQIAMNIAQTVKEGEVNPMEMAVRLSAIEKVVELVRAEITENVLTELAKETGKATSLGAKLVQKEVGVKYSYDCEAWQAIKQREDEISAKRKEIEKMCQLCPDGTELNWTDVTSGETLTITKATKSSKTSFAVTLPTE